MVTSHSHWWVVLSSLGFACSGQQEEQGGWGVVSLWRGSGPAQRTLSVFPPEGF